MPDRLSSRKFSTACSRCSCTEQLCPPLAADGLEPADHFSTDAACFALPEPAVPLPLLDPAVAFLAVLVFPSQLGDELARGPESAGCSRG